MLIYGRNVALEAIKKEKIKKAYIYKNIVDRDIIGMLNCPVKYVDKMYLNKMVDGLHQGIVLDVEDYSYYDIEDVIDDEFIVMLDHIEDPHNFGAIIRNCEAAGVKSIVIPKDRSVEINGTVYKTSVGTLPYVKIVQVTNLTNTINYLKKNGYWIVGTNMNGTDYDKIDYKGKTVIIIGNEGSGISSLVYKNCDFMATIPMN